MGDLEVQWDVFSLAIQNYDGDLANFDKSSATGVTALRTCVLVLETDGNDATGRLYSALASARHDNEANVDDHDVIRAALAAADLPQSRLKEALANSTTFDGLMTRHLTLIDETPASGVPAIVLDGGSGPAVFGPVISNPPETTEDARQLWKSIAWLTRYDNFSELKRDRTIDPDLESVRNHKQS